MGPGSEAEAWAISESKQLFFESTRRFALRTRIAHERSLT
jgi:hypothetical protein